MGIFFLGIVTVQRCVTGVFNSNFKACCGFLSRTRFSCSHMVVKTILYCTRKCGCKAGCMSASCFLQPPRNGSTGEVPVLEHEIFSRTVLNFLKDCPRNVSYMHEVFLGQSQRKFHVPGRGPDQLNRCKVAAESSLLTCSRLCSHISWYNTTLFLPRPRMGNRTVAEHVCSKM